MSRNRLLLLWPDYNNLRLTMLPAVLNLAFLILNYGK